MNRRLARFAASAAVLGASVLTPAAARADGPSADEIAKKSLEHDTFGFEGSQIKARLVLVEADGRTQERAFEGISKKGTDTLIRSVIRFTAPATIAGTSFLMIQHQGAPDEQHIYLPRMKTTRRIGGTGEREGSFMGSDFSYADLERKDLREATYSRLPDDAVGKETCFHIEAVPKTQSAYGKLSLWIRQKDFLPLRVQMFDKEGKLLKTTFTRRIKDVDGKPVVVETHTENAQTNHKTDLVIDEIKFQADLSDALFTPAALSH